MFDIKKLIIDVFNPQNGENVILLNDFPADESKITAEYLERKQMTRLWKKAFEELAQEKNFSVEPIIYYKPTKVHSGPLPEKAMQKKKLINLHEKLDSLNKKDIVIAITTFSATGPIHSRLKDQNFRSATLPGATMDMSAFESDYSIIAKKLQQVLSVH